MSPERNSAAYPNVTHYALPFRVPGSREERKGLHYYSSYAAAQMGGPSTADFWSLTILQRCQHETPLRHATAALGQLHVEYMASATPAAFTPSAVAVQCYGRAVKSLRNSLDRGAGLDGCVVLMCCAVLYCFELVRGEKSAAMRHLDGGLQMLQHLRKNALTERQSDEEKKLLAVFARMDLEATLFDDDRLPVLRMAWDQLDDAGKVDGGGKCRETVQGLHQNVFLLSHMAFVFVVENVRYKSVHIRHVPARVINRRKELVDRLDCWHQMAYRWELQTSGISADARAEHLHRTTIATARLHCGVVRLLLLHALQDDIRAAAPTFDDEAARWLEAAQVAMSPRLGDEADAASSMACYFSLHLGVVGPLFLLAMKVRSAGARETVLDVLRSAQGRREGFYDASLTVETVATLMEKAAAATDTRGDCALEFLV